MSQTSSSASDAASTASLLLSNNKNIPWDTNIYEVLLSATSLEKSLPFPIEGGSDAGLFCTIGSSINPSQLIYHPIISSPTPNSPKKSPSILRPGDVILEVGDYQISGFTYIDAVRLCKSLFYPTKGGDRPRVLLKLISPSSLPTGDAHLSRFLAAQFKVGTPEFLLQEVTRNNIYQRVIPCTTREPRPEERDGVDYQFLPVERFLDLEKSGHLLESGMYKGNHYGTPRPDASASALNLDTIASPKNITKQGAIQSGPLSATANGRDAGITSESANANEEFQHQQQQAPSMQLQQLTSERDLSSIPLPNGWEVIDHPEFGLFYIDHIHQKTQYEPPTEADFEESARLQAAVGNCSSLISTTPAENNTNGNGSFRSAENHQGVSGLDASGSDKFTDEVAQIKGPLVTVVLVKGPKGFGFTIVGGSSPGQPGFLQVKNVIPGGPAAEQGTLGVGNVIVSANGVSVLGFSHDQIVALFQSIPVGGTVSLTISQGYTLSSKENAAGIKKAQFPQCVSGNSVETSSSIDHFTHYHLLDVLSISSTTRGGKPGNLECSVPFAPPELCIRRLNTSPTISQLSGEEDEGGGIGEINTSGSRSNGGSGALVTVPVSVTKQANGFGFTLADQVGGQRVKEVLEPRGLQVGDVILEVNGKWVKDASHLEVVQMLKSCPVGKTANFLIQRAAAPSSTLKHTSSPLGDESTPPPLSSPQNRIPLHPANEIKTMSSQADRCGRIELFKPSSTATVVSSKLITYLMSTEVENDDLECICIMWFQFTSVELEEI
ncbi:hypothetical protein Aperf_G00000063448 [Anoplocephala perfoliata]